jgi:SpoVK/Ycf46/Vps4 family AAA+-type ATPase
VADIRNLSNLAKKITPAATAATPVLSPPHLQAVQALATQLLRNPPVTASQPATITLFAGPDTAAKTAAARALADNLHRQLHRVDLGAVGSKYIGETSKDLAQILHTSDPSSVILLFDEGDALFGKRTEVKDSHDRYANQSTGASDDGSNLLQLLRQYPGIVILAINSTDGCSPALLAQAHTTLKFPPTP